MFHVQDTSLLEDIRRVFKLCEEILNEEKVSFESDDLKTVPKAPEIIVEDEDLSNAPTVPMKKMKKRKSEVERLKIEMKGFSHMFYQWMYDENTYSVDDKRTIVAHELTDEPDQDDDPRELNEEEDFERDQ